MMEPGGAGRGRRIFSAALRRLWWFVRWTDRSGSPEAVAERSPSAATRTGPRFDEPASTPDARPIRTGGDVRNVVRARISTGDTPDELALLQSTVTPHRDDAAVRIELGHRLWQLGRHEDAIGAFQAAVALEPDNVKALAPLGRALRRRADHAGALAVFRAAVAVKPDDPDLWVEAARDLRQLERLEEAEAACRSALSIDPDHVDALRLLVRLLGNRGEIRDAALHLERVTVLQPADATARIDLGHLYRQMGRIGDAAVAFHAALTVEPTNVAALAPLGHMLRRLGDHAGAVAAFELAAAQQPRNAGLRIEITRSLRDLGRLDEATSACASALGIEPENKTALRLQAGLLKSSGRFREAAESLAKFAAQAPMDADVRIELGHTYRQLGRYEAAERVFGEAVALQPDNVAALGPLGHMRRRLGDRAGALEAFAAAARMQPGTVEFLVNVAVDLEVLERNDEAEAAARAVLDLDPANAVATRILANNLRRRGDVRQAVAAFEEVVARARGNVELATELARFQANVGNFRRADELLRGILDRQPDNIDALLMLAQLHQDHFRFGEAQALLERALAVDPGRVATLLALGRLTRLRGDRPRALEYLRAAQAVDPASAQANLALASLLRDLGDFEPAQALLEELIRRNSAVHDAMMQLGFLRRRQGDRARAAEAFLAASEKSPSRVEPLLELSVEYRALGRPIEAKRLIDEALARDPFSLEALAQALDYARAEEDFDRQIDLIELLRTHHPSVPRSYILSAYALADMGNEDSAFEMLDRADEAFGVRPDTALARADILRNAGRLAEASGILESVPDELAPTVQFAVIRANLAILRAEWDEADRLIAGIPITTTQDQARAHFLRGQVREGLRDYPAARACYIEAISRNATEPQYHLGLAGTCLLMLDLEATRRNLATLVRLDKAKSILRHRSRNISQSHLGQLLDEFALDRAALDRLRAACALEGAPRLDALVEMVRSNPDHTPSAMMLLLHLRRSSLFRLDAAPASGGLQVPREIIQFWDDPTPPPGVRDLMRGWHEANPGWRHTVYCDNTALEFLRANHPHEVSRAFLRSRHPAQRADIFRLARLLVTGGIYVDADDRSVAPIESFVPSAARMLAYQEKYCSIGNNVLAVVPGHPVIRRALETATEAVNRGDADLLWLATGPGLITRSLAQAIAAAWPRVDWQADTAIVELGIIRRFVGLHCRLPYKKTPKHWARSTRA